MKLTPPGLAKNDKKSAWAQAGRYSQLAVVMPACVFVGYAIGYYLDKAFGTSYLYLVFLLIGIAAGFLELIREVQKDIE